MQQQIGREIHLGKSNVVGGLQGVLSTLECLLCDGVVVQPWECSNCQKLFCGREIGRLRTQKCPNNSCNGTNWKKGTAIHSAYRSMLSELKFRCSDVRCANQNPIPYEQYIRHLRDTNHCDGSTTPANRVNRLHTAHGHSMQHIIRESPPSRPDTPPSMFSFGGQGQIIRKNIATARNQSPISRP